MENGVNDYNDPQKLARLVQYFESAEQATFESRELAERDRDYYDNDQWTDDELATLKKRKQPPITINRIKPKVNFLLGQEAQHRTLPRAFPRTPKHEEAAQAASDALRFVIEDTRFAQTRSEAAKNLWIEGACGVDVSVSQVGDDYKINIDLIPWDRMFYDEHSRKRGFQDAKFLGQVVWLDLEDGIAKFGEDARQFLEGSIAFESSQGNTFDDVPRVRWADAKRKRVRIVEMWHQDGAQWHHCIFTKGGIISSTPSPYTDEEGNSVPGFIFGSCYIDRDGNRYGVVRDWIGIQDEINKRRSKALHLLSVRQVQAEKGAVADVNKARQELAKPDGYVETNPGLAFNVLPTGDMAQAQFNLLQEAKNEIDAVGVNAALSGTESRVMSGRALMAKSEQGLSELGPVFDMVKQFELDIYRAVWCRIRQFWTAEKWVRVTDDENNLKWVGLNQPLTLGMQLLEEAKQQGKEITPEMELQAQCDPMMQQVVGTKNQVADLDVDITIDDVPASVSLQAEQFETLAKLAEMPHMNIPPKTIVQASNLRNKEQIIKDMGADGPPPQFIAMQKQMEQMGQALEDMKRKLEAAKSDNSVEAYNAETERLKVMGAGMGPEQLQAIIAQTVQYVLQSPDVLPGGPPMPQMQTTQPASAGFFTPEMGQPMNAGQRMNMPMRPQMPA